MLTRYFLSWKFYWSQFCPRTSWQNDHHIICFILLLNVGTDNRLVVSSGSFRRLMGFLLSTPQGTFNSAWLRSSTSSPLSGQHRLLSDSYRKAMALTDTSDIFVSILSLPFEASSPHLHAYCGRMTPLSGLLTAFTKLEGTSKLYKFVAFSLIGLKGNCWDLSKQVSLGLPHHCWHSDLFFVDNFFFGMLSFLTSLCSLFLLLSCFLPLSFLIVLLL